MNNIFHANGKLLLTAEYFVLAGATALAIPVKYGQSLEVSMNNADENLHWESYDQEGNCWFEAIFQKDGFEILKQNDEAIADRLRSILQAIKSVSPQFKAQNLKLKTHLSFERNWGLGTSSTLVFLLANWAGVDPFRLQFDTFGGSGYDIACAGAAGPILYKKEAGKPFVESCKFNPPFVEQLYFVFLRKKQDSREGIGRFEGKRKKEKERSVLNKISELTQSFLIEKKLDKFDQLIQEHEQLVGEFLDMPRAKELYFSDFWGEVKSLGAWGGDFVLVTSNRTKQETQIYFNEKGFDVFIPYKDMVL